MKTCKNCVFDEEMPNYKEVINMTDEQLDEIDRKVEDVLVDKFAYLDLGNDAIPEAIHNAKEDIIKMVEDIMDKIRG